MYNATIIRQQAEVDAWQAETYEATAKLHDLEGKPELAADYCLRAARYRAYAEDGYKLANEIDAGKVP